MHYTSHHKYIMAHSIGLQTYLQVKTIVEMSAYLQKLQHAAFSLIT